MKQVEAQLIHDMRNTATVIRGAAEMLHASHRTMSDDAVEHVTSMLSRRSDMLARLLEDLATVHAIERGDLAIELQVVELAEIFRDIDAEVEPGARVIGDPLRVSQIVDNLLSNAHRYGGGLVSVRVWTEGSLVRIEVSDNGPGVAPELVDTLFDLYSRGAVSRMVGGSGLGLAIVQQLCAVQGGSIDYDGTSGATFTASLPAVPAVPGSLSPDAAQQGHSVSFWTQDDELAESVADYVANGLVGGEAVLVAVTDDHRRLIDARLAELGFDVDEVVARGQYVPLDAGALQHTLQVDGHVDPAVFDSVVGAVVEVASARWVTFRVFGEIVDLYWRDGDSHLALELEDCWNELRSRIPFPLYCGYQIAPDQDSVCGCHDAVLVA